MWARWCELAIAAWLAAAPWVLAVDPPGTIVAVDLVTALLVAALAVACLVRPGRPLHVATFALALLLTLYGWLLRAGHPPVHENHVLTGLVLAMFALVPNGASRPPRPWRAPRGDEPRRHEQA